MSRFEIGDKVILNEECYPLFTKRMKDYYISYGTLIEMLPSDRCIIKWRNGMTHIYKLEFVELYMDGYYDFLDKIQDRLK